MKILPIGKFHEINQRGEILNCCIYPIIQKEYEIPIYLAVDGIKDKIGNKIHSIYLRGSVAKGIAIHDISDIDLVILSKDKISEQENQELYSEVASKICSQYRFIKGIEMYCQHIDTLKNTSAQFMFKTQCICIEGQDIIPSLPNFLISTPHLYTFHSLASNISSTIEGKHSMPWLMKKIVRAGLELCMTREQCYTRDLYPCYEIFRKYYPEKEPQMKIALEIAIGNKIDKIEGIALIHEIGNFLLTEVRKVYSF